MKNIFGLQEKILTHEKKYSTHEIKVLTHEKKMRKKRTHANTKPARLTSVRDL